MSRGDLANLQVQLELQTAAFERGMNRAVGQINKFDARTKRSTRSLVSMDRTVKTLSRSIKSFGLALASAFTVGAIKNAVAFGDTIAKTASAVGLTAEQFQEFSFAADLAGVATSQFNSNMTAFVKRVGEAQAGMGPLVSGLKNLNPELLEAVKNAGSQSEAFQLIVDAMDKASSATERAAIANAAFSRSGVAMANITTQGLKSGADAAHELGTVMSETTTKKAEFLQDRITEMSTAIKYRLTSAAINATAAIMNLFGVFTEQGELQREIDKIKAEILDLEGKLGSGPNPRANKAYRDNLKNLQKYLTDLEEQMAAFEEKAKKAEMAGADVGKGLSDGLEEVLVTARKFNQDFNINALESVVESAKYAADGLLAFQERLDLLDTAFALKLINVEQYNAELKKMQENTEFLQEIEVTARFSKDIIGDVDNFKDSALSALEEIRQATEGFVTDFTNTLVDGLAAGELRFKDFAANVLKTIAKMMLNRVFTQFLNAIMPNPGVQSGVGGLLNQPGLFAAPAGAGPTTLSTPAIGQAMNVGVLQPPTYGQGAAGARSQPVNVTVNNNAPVDVEVQQGDNGRGGVDINMFIENKMASSIANGGLDKPLNAAFGLARRAW